MNPDIENLILEEFKKYVLEADKCNTAYFAITGKDIKTDVIKDNVTYHLNADTMILKTKSALNGGHFTIALNGNRPVPTKGYNKSAPTKRKILSLIHIENRFLRKRELIQLFAKIEKIHIDTELIQAVTNALANLRKDKEVVNYKPNGGVKQKGGYWGIPQWLENGEPKQEYEITGEMIYVD